MNAPLRSPMTVEQFLEWEARQEQRHEFDGFGPVTRTRGNVAHAAVQVALLTALATRLRGTPCRAYGGGLKIAVAGRIRYPDAFISCSLGSASQTVVTDPVVVFEVLSNSTSNEDLVIKNAEYRATPSIRRYVVLQPDKPGALVFFRKGEDWVAETLNGIDAMLALPESGLEISLSEIYSVDPGDAPDAILTATQAIESLQSFDRVSGVEPEALLSWIDEGRR